MVKYTLCLSVLVQCVCRSMPVCHCQSQNVYSGDSSVIRAPDLRSKGRRFESLLERRENFLLQGQLSVLTRYFGICSTPVLPQ